MKKPLIALAMALCLTAPAAAQEMLPNTVEALRAQAAARGPVTVIPPSADYPDPYLDAQANGYYYLMIMIGCQGMFACEQVEFSASFTTDEPRLEFVNNWNAGNRIGTAYIEEGSVDEVLLSYTVLIEPPMTVPAFREVLAFWIDTMDAFSNQLYGFEQGAGGGGGGGK